MHFWIWYQPRWDITSKGFRKIVWSWLMWSRLLINVVKDLDILHISHFSFILLIFQMSEKDFWTKYCKAEYLQWSKNSATVAAEAAEDEELAIFLKHDDLLANEARRKVLRRPTSQTFSDLFGSIWQCSLCSPTFKCLGMPFFFLFFFYFYGHIPYIWQNFLGADETCWSNLRRGSWSRGWLHASSCMWHFLINSYFIWK